ncbi:hypothetical protein [Streptomyces beijiangensis]|uniref:Secreted protein n=1 Tax=Streptomyces beijiangensis TaxID=163361 RepID=A0A939JJ10_9ACTN|nr:hypothetical protein [Streptomyces beijiangensis]MBO0514247.1 hypothetical protein [Streptomyces beijiangensis]
MNAKTVRTDANPTRTGRGRRTAALGLATLFAAAAVATTTSCAAHGSKSAAATTAPAKAAAAPAKAAATVGKPAVEGKAFGLNPYAWATRRSSTIGIYGITLHGQSFSYAQVRLAVFKDGGFPGVPSWTATTTAHYVSGRPGGAFDVTTGLLDCTAYGYRQNSTLMVLDLATNTWSNKVRVSTGCGAK